MSDDFLERIASILGTGYHVERELGGGMSRVVVARDVALGRQVVVKVLPADWAAGLSAERFRREVVLAAGLQHPHIVPLLAAAEAADGTLYYTMPYVDGQSLRSRLRDGVPALGDTVKWLRDVASALAYAHARGVVHRDMKPDNILLSGGYAVVADFGIAKALSNASATMTRMPAAMDPITTIGMSMGTPAYMAPEQVAADGDADSRTDLYALGVIAYELLTGETPFTGSSQAILVAHLSAEPVPVDTRRAGLPEALSTLVMQCLSKEVADRPRTASEVVTILESVLRTISADDAVAAPRITGKTAGAVSPPTGRGARSSRTKFVIGGVAIAAIATSAALLWPRLRTEPLVAHRVAVATLRDASPDSSLGEIARTVAGDIASELSALDSSDVAAREDVERIEGQFPRGATLPTAIATPLRAGLIVTGVVSAIGADSVRIRIALASGADGKTIRALRDVDVPRTELRAATADLRQRLAGAILALTSRDFTRAMLPGGDPPLRVALLSVREGLQLEASLRQPDPNEDEGIAELIRFDNAIVADPEYAQARLWFASAALRRPGGEVLADSALLLVQEQQSTLTEYERALLDALRADAGGNHELSVRGWRRAEALAPVWPNRWWLAIKLRDANRPRESLAHFDTLGKANPHFLRSLPGLRHYVADYAGEYGALRDERARAPSTAQSLGFQQALLQALAAMDSLVVVTKLLDDASQLPAEPGSSLAFLLTRTSWELSAHGHATEAKSALQRAAAWCGRRTAVDLANGAVAFDCMEAYAYAGNVAALAALAEPSLRSRPDDIDLSVLGVLGVAAALGGERATAEQFATRIERATRADGSHGLASWLRARIHAALGDNTKAVELLEDAFARGAGWTQRLDLHRDPALAKLRGDASFDRLGKPQG